MCGRYSFVPTARQLAAQLSGIALPAQLSFSYHIAPTQLGWLIVSTPDWSLRAMQWGLVPAWSPSFRPSGRTINARAETLFEKPSFREAARYRRCVVLADSFYEWQRQPDGRRTPFRILPSDGALLFMAGIWEEWRGSGEVHQTFAIVTVPANADLHPLHDRMPALLLGEDQWRCWLSLTTSEHDLRHLLRPAPRHYLAYYRVSERLNKPGFDDPSLHEPVSSAI